MIDIPRLAVSEAVRLDRRLVYAFSRQRGVVRSQRRPPLSGGTDDI